MVTQAQQGFLSTYAPYAQVASSDTGVPWQTILAQWADETGFGTAPAFATGNNFAGVSPGGQVASYPSLAAGLAAYIQTLLAPAYATVRNAGSSGPVAAAQALGNSPWAASHYASSGGGPGSDLVAILDETGLASASDPNAVLTSTGSGAGAAIGGWVTDPLSPIGLDPLGTQGIGSSIGGAIGGAAQSAGGDVASAVVNDLISAVKKPALTALFLVLAAGLVGAGVWTSVAPKVRQAGQKAAQAAPAVAEAAA